MKKRFLLVLGAAGMLAACTNQDVDSRLAQLEQRVATLEAEGAHNHQPAATPVSYDPASQEQLSAEPAAQPKTDGPVAAIQYEQIEYDFGTVKEGAVVEHVYKFKNSGSVPLIIQSAVASCGCTVPDYSKKPIPPGQSGEIKVRFDSATRPGIQNKTVTVTANTEPAITRLTIKGNVEPKAGAAAAAGAEGPVRN
jgi:hypothetical protein